ncbi:MAG: HDOD domain-containing protein [Chromatiaceae bacterium]|nr:HDOD domain-containing protein [Chromatiaceae bacterium]MCP5444614.1 HDOD domain-containing protein [Chromatiaceae bacterium]
MQDYFIGRQAIFDRRLRVFAYELLYREGNTSGAPSMDGDRATSRLMLNAFTEMGLDRIAGDQRVFFNMTRSLLMDMPEFPFGRERLVLEILEDIEVNDEFVQRISVLRKEGYTLALDDFEFEDKWLPLIPHIDILKVEVPALNWDKLPLQIEKVHRNGMLLLAEKVETEGEYRQLHELGFDLFQGYYFSKPNVVAGKRLSENQLITLKLLAKLNDPEATPKQLENLIVQDPGLVYKILRYLNSASLAMPRKIESIQQAIIYLGLQRLRGWASLIAISRVEDQPEELFTIALVRAHMCAKLTAISEGKVNEGAFTVGLLSVLDLLMGKPMTKILERIPLSDSVKQALLYHAGTAGRALLCARSFEQEDEIPTGFPGLNTGEIQEIFLQSSELAFQEQRSLLAN